MADELEIRRRRALYRAQHRGTREMDWLLGRFAEARLWQMEVAALSQFEVMMDEPDPQLQRWIMRSEGAADGTGAGLAAARDEAADMPAGYATLIGALREFHGLARAATDKS